MVSRAQDSSRGDKLVDDLHARYFVRLCQLIEGYFYAVPVYWVEGGVWVGKSLAQAGF